MEVGKDDKLGRKLQDAKLVVKERAPKILKNDILRSNNITKKPEERQVELENSLDNTGT
jgi:hypothetical protein